ncbi:MAG: hypothetical protein QW503_06390 [Sulfolobales archaeon]
MKTRGYMGVRTQNSVIAVIADPLFLRNEFSIGLQQREWWTPWSAITGCNWARSPVIATLAWSAIAPTIALLISVAL